MTTEQILADGRRRIAEAWEKEKSHGRTRTIVAMAHFNGQRTALESFCDWIEAQNQDTKGNA
jgi:hypothetical protein